MPENKWTPDALAETLSREPGSLESRAVARMILAGPGRAPSFIVTFVDSGPRNEQGGMFAGPVTLESQIATVNGKTLTRSEGETSEAFERRACLELPALAPGFVVMFADANDDVSAAEDYTGATGTGKAGPKIST